MACERSYIFINTTVAAFLVRSLLLNQSLSCSFH